MRTVVFIAAGLVPAVALLRLAPASYRTLAWELRWPRH